MTDGIGFREKTVLAAAYDTKKDLLDNGGPGEECVFHVGHKEIKYVILRQEDHTIYYQKFENGVAVGDPQTHTR